jgi:hypothetical protein
LRLRCFVVIELKVGDFKPEHAGKMNFYLSAVDDLLRHPDDRSSIGLILCKSQNQLVCRVRLARYEQAHWCGHLSPHREFACRAAGKPAEH